MSPFHPPLSFKMNVEHFVDDTNRATRLTKHRFGELAHLLEPLEDCSLSPEGEMPSTSHIVLSVHPLPRALR